MTEDIEYFENKKADKTYISKRIVNTNLEGNLTRPVRIASHVFDPAETYSQARVAGQVVLRATARVLNTINSATRCNIMPPLAARLCRHPLQRYAAA